MNKRKGILQNRPAFIKRLATLMEEGYTFHDAVNLLLPHHWKGCKEEIAEQIDNAFKAGHGVVEVLTVLGFSAGTLLPVVIAEMDGKLILALYGMARRLEKIELQRKKLKNLLIYPIFLFLMIFLLLLAFRKYFLPNMKTLVGSRPDDMNKIVGYLPTFVSKMPDIFIVMLLLGVCLVVVATYSYRKCTPVKKIQIFMSLPFAGTFFSMIKTRSFAGEMGSLLQSGLSLQQALDVLINQKLDAVVSEMAKDVKELVIHGEPLHAAIELTQGLTPHLADFAKHGSDSGHLPKELLLYSEQLEETIDVTFNRALALLQPLLFSIIAVCILSAYLALLLPVYGMMDKL
ncbi:competence type IV pilus assembly protein ComGB [Sporosarcina sp. HYO08]|uniref:competence type IV pilus assembly protein ComGB n=1 Tax=Sporosarcina sp. HYO08 TaxID=1759557 RepID=UPI000797471D|nr:competence type IV pilus assembly protein ComGB [Sporosarcina sp. HYO08]KXH87446.1 hypothetical protein AU377_02420 [Sporosarcina sp. HYO08]